MGGVLVSYHLREGLGGDLSTECGTASGCEGLVMESCTETTVGALWRPEGDGVLAQFSHQRGVFAGQMTGAKWKMVI